MTVRTSILLCRHRDGFSAHFTSRGLRVQHNALPFGRPNVLVTHRRIATTSNARKPSDALESSKVRVTWLDVWTFERRAFGGL